MSLKSLCMLYSAILQTAFFDVENVSVVVSSTYKDSTKV